MPFMTKIEPDRKREKMLLKCPSAQDNSTVLVASFSRQIYNVQKFIVPLITR